MNTRWALIWMLPLLASLLVGGLLLSTLMWAATRTDAIALDRQRELLTRIVSDMRDGIAHDQESATVWDDAVRNTQVQDLEWLQLNLGEWMHTYFGHDAAVVLSADGKPIYEFVAESDRAPSKEALSAAYQRIVPALQKRLAASDSSGVTDRVLSIGESDVAFIGARPAIVSAKPIVSDSGDIEQEPGRENIHVAFRFLDDDFLATIGNNYRFADLKFSIQPPQDAEHAFVTLTSRSGADIGNFSWAPFKPGTSMMEATLPAVLIVDLVSFITLHFGGRALLRRSARLVASREELHHLALHDALTGLVNRAHFNNELATHLNAALSDERNTVLFVDLDRFKAVNDTFGHPAGDQLLVQVANRMRSIMPKALIARIGGDEFTLLLKEHEEEETAAACKQIVDCLREPYSIEGAHVVIGASVGAAAAIGKADALDLTRQADIALYHAKSAGRNTFAIFGTHMDEVLRDRRNLEHQLRVALESRTQIETFYQPVYSAADKGLRSMEALARWRHPERGFIPPDVFIPIAEEMGLIHEIGSVVLENACSLLAELPTLTVAVNASPLELNSPDYPVRVIATLNRWGIEPDRVEIEITESVALADGGQGGLSIELLRNAGIRFAIDDFGTGYSSFQRIQDIKVDRIKIDKSFVRDIQQGRSKPLIEAMITMAHTNGLKITAEGVETDEQCLALKSLGCDSLQGFLLSQPLPRADFLALLGRGIPAAGAA